MYIHFSLVCVAGPTEETVVKFWQMVWEYQLTTIVMLTRCVEDNKVTVYTYEVVTYSIVYYYSSLVMHRTLYHIHCGTHVYMYIYTIGKM